MTLWGKFLVLLGVFAAALNLYVWFRFGVTANLIFVPTSLLVVVVAVVLDRKTA